MRKVEPLGDHARVIDVLARAAGALFARQATPS